MPDTAASLPLPTAVLFGLSGCLVDFGATHRPAMCVEVLQEPPSPATLTPGAAAALAFLASSEVPCAWLEQLPARTCSALARELPSSVHSVRKRPNTPPWPAPDACWQALMQLGIGRLEGCILVSGDPLLLRSGLNAGLWTIGLASCGPLCGLGPEAWQALNTQQREHKRARATLDLFALGVHSVIDHLEALPNCLGDIGLRRFKGEKP